MERRRSGRRAPAAEEPLARVRLRTGGELVVIDLGGTGALVDGTARLLPGSHVGVQVVTPGGRVFVRSRVVRSVVVRIAPEGIWYQSALAFDRPIDTDPRG